MFGKKAGAPTYLSLAAPVDGFTHRRSLRARPPFTRPCRSFCCAFAELIRGQMPPDDFCNYLRRAGNQTIRLSFSSQGRRPRSPSFSLRTTPPIAGQWHAASRAPSASKAPVLVRPVTRFTQPRCLRERPTTAEFPRRCIVRIDVHGSKDRAKDASRVRMRRCPVPASGAYAYRAQADVVPLLGLPSDIRCHRRVRPPRRKPR